MCTVGRFNTPYDGRMRVHGILAFLNAGAMNPMDELHQPLQDDELNWLNDFLLDRIDENAAVEGKDEGILDAPELDGLLTAVVSGPVTILPSQWLPQVWGDFAPTWNDEKDVQTVMTLLMRHMNGIAVMLMERPADFEPMFLGGRVTTHLPGSGGML